MPLGIFPTKYKICVIGREKGEKREFFSKLSPIGFDFRDSFKETLGVSFYLLSVPILVDSESLKIGTQIWDITIDLRFRFSVNNYFSDADGFLLFCNLHKPEKFDDILYWIKYIRKNYDSSIPALLVAVKNTIDKQEMEDLVIEICEKFKIKYHLVYGIENMQHYEILIKLIGELRKNDPELRKSIDKILESKNYSDISDITPDNIDDYFKIINKKLDFISLEQQPKIKSFEREELEEVLNNIKDETIFHKKVLFPILRDLKCEDVRILHGPNEMGKDILFKTTNLFGLPEYNIMVVKTGKIDQRQSGKINKYIEEIFDQIKTGKIVKYKDLNLGKLNICRVFVTTNDDITDRAKEVLSALDPKIRGNIFFIYRDVLLNLF